MFRTDVVTTTLLCVTLACPVFESIAAVEVIATVFLASDLKHGIRDDRVASFVRAFPRTVDLAGLNLTKTAEWASLTGDAGAKSSASTVGGDDGDDDGAVTEGIITSR